MLPLLLVCFIGPGLSDDAEPSSSVGLLIGRLHQLSDTGRADVDGQEFLARPRFIHVGLILDDP